MMNDGPFLALLDSVSRAYSMGLLFVVRLSSVCAIDYFGSYRMDFFQSLVVAFPGPYAQTFFFFFFLYEYFSFSLTWDPMGAKVSKRYSSFKSQPNVFLNFLPNGPHQTAFVIFKILKI